jgi:hypothetical protein
MKTDRLYPRCEIRSTCAKLHSPSHIAPISAIFKLAIAAVPSADSVLGLPHAKNASVRAPGVHRLPGQKAELRKSRHRPLAVHRTRRSEHGCQGRCARGSVYARSIAAAELPECASRDANARQTTAAPQLLSTCCAAPSASSSGRGRELPLPHSSPR